MRHIPFIFVVSLLLSSCSGSEEPTNDSNSASGSNNDSLQGSITQPSYFLSKDKCDSSLNSKGDYFVVNYAGVTTELEAIHLVDSLLPKFSKAGYLWIPDFASLSGKELYAVFIDHGQYGSYLLENTVQKHKVEIDGIYVVRVNQNTERWVAYSPIDIRIDGTKQRMILIYAKPEEEQEYGEGGGEDWGWFVNEVCEYFGNNHPEIGINNLYHCGMLPEEISKIENTLDLEGFGYIMIDGKKMDFVPHDMSSGVISSATDFFGLENKF